ncbi:serine/threonine protein kinase [Macrococcus sp. TMW 2.2395]|nr:serine/threonine protein kinase [Macrococcus sp. TMW 2.2395]
MTLLNEAFKEISNVFIGDKVDLYNYKTGAKLVEFFNQYFNYRDVYKQGFPSRWFYVSNNLIDLYNKGKINQFFTLILSKEFILTERKKDEVDAISHSTVIFQELRRILRPYSYDLIKSNDSKVKLVSINKDLIYVASGGYANVYLQQSTGYIVKKLKEDFVVDSAIRSRFKREFNITKSLNDLSNIIRVYDFDEQSCSYQMEKAEVTLEKYIKNYDITFEQRITLIRQILDIMSKVHERDIIHRDLSPTNIFILNGMIKISDFGLGKDLNMFSSHQTITTHGVGQFYYCAPEQFMLLKDGDMKSDVYSLGRIITFVLTGEIKSDDHQFMNLIDKACNENPAYRFNNASDLYINFERRMKIINDKNHDEKMLAKIIKGKYEDDVLEYLYGLAGNRICELIANKHNNINQAIIKCMENDDKQAQIMIAKIFNNYIDVAGKDYNRYDGFAKLSSTILKMSFSFIVLEISAKILVFVACSVNRFYAQDLVKEVINFGIDPMIEDILTEQGE